MMAARNLYQRCVSTQRGMKVEGVRFDEWETLDQKTRLKRLTDALELIGDRISDLTAIQREHTEEEREKARLAETGPRPCSSTGRAVSAGGDATPSLVLQRADRTGRPSCPLRASAARENRAQEALAFASNHLASTARRAANGWLPGRPHTTAHAGHRCGQRSCSRTPYMRRRKVAWNGVPSMRPGSGMSMRDRPSPTVSMEGASWP